MRTNIFQLGDFKLHSGKSSKFKIECDNLELEDLITFAQLVSDKLKFGAVYGIPRGGIQFAEVLKTHIDKNSDKILIVDDVFSTGTSINEFLKQFAVENHILPVDKLIGTVIFSRGNCPAWIYPLFQYNGI